MKVCIVNSVYDLTTSADIGLLHEHDVCTLQIYLRVVVLSIHFIRVTCTLVSYRGPEDQLKDIQCRPVSASVVKSSVGYEAGSSRAMERYLRDATRSGLEH